MLDEKKVKLMTRLAFYEQTQGKEDFKVSAYYAWHMLFPLGDVWLCVRGRAGYAGRHGAAAFEDVKRACRNARGDYSGRLCIPGGPVYRDIQPHL